MSSPDSQHPNDPAVPPTRPRSRKLGITFVLTAFLAIVLIRNMAPDLDFAVVNVVSWLLGVAGWISSYFVLRTFPNGRRLARLVLWGPIVAAVAFLILFRFQRIDGELRPKFVFRWAREAPPPIPESTVEPTFVESIFAPTDHDFPQFLGPNRDAVLSKPELDPDWQAHPPAIAWKQPIGEGWSAYAVQGKVAVTMEQRGDEEWVTAYNIDDGSLLWHYAIPARHYNVMGGVGPRSTPTIAGERVYACSAVSQFVCLDLATGERRWSRSLLELAGCNQQEFEEKVSWGRAASPLVVDERVIIPLGGAHAPINTLIAFDAETGAELWRGGEDQISYSSPVLATLDGVQMILQISENMLGAYAPNDGELLWSTPWPGSSHGSASCSQPVLVGDNRILLTKGYGVGARLIEVHKRDTGWEVETVWENSTVLKTKFTTTVHRDGYAYALSDGILECVDVANGRRVWKRGRYRQGQLLLIGDYLLISAEDGHIALVPAKPDGYTELARLKVIDGVTWNTLSLSGNRLLIRNSDEAACVILPTRENRTEETTDAGESQTARSVPIRQRGAVAGPAGEDLSGQS